VFDYSFYKYCTKSLVQASPHILSSTNQKINNAININAHLKKSTSINKMESTFYQRPPRSKEVDGLVVLDSYSNEEKQSFILL
jgi:hypothetical protein